MVGVVSRCIVTVPANCRDLLVQISNFIVIIRGKIYISSTSKEFSNQLANN